MVCPKYSQQKNQSALTEVFFHRSILDLIASSRIRKEGKEGMKGYLWAAVVIPITLYVRACGGVEERATEGEPRN